MVQLPAEGRLPLSCRLHLPIWRQRRSEMPRAGMPLARLPSLVCAFSQLWLHWSFCCQNDAEG